MADLSATLALPGLSAWAYDPARGIVNVLTSDGVLRGWNVASRTYQYTANVGGAPGSAEVSADGRYLLVGDAVRYVTSDPFAVDKSYAAQVLRVDLADLSVAPMRFAVTSFEAGVSDVSVSGG